MGTEFRFYKIASLPEAEGRDGSIEPCLIVLVVFNTIDRISLLPPSASLTTDCINTVE